MIRAGILIIILLSFSIHNLTIAQNRNGAYQYTVDLIDIKNDMAKVELLVPESLKKETLRFEMPKIVPGTYSIYDFGRFIHDFEALDSKGNSLPVNRLSANVWEINASLDINKITYWVEDSYDSEKDTTIFEPAGTNIEEGKNYLINTFGYFGYIDSLKRVPFDINIKKPVGFYGATPLKVLQKTDDSDRFLSQDYYELVDSPIMYTIPDTASIYLGETRVEISVYSPNKILTAKEVMSKTNEILEAQARYLGGNLPVDKYVILIYLFDKIPKSQGAGALEHSFSTVFSMREQSLDRIEENIISVTAHEFFHVLTPLTIHSNEIHNFDFQDPKMSKHLWLYEGLTEYAAGHVQLKEGMISFNDYLEMMRGKIRFSKTRFNDTLPFTVMSKGCLDEYEDQYPNVYLKGALIGLCLDITLRSYSEGEYGTQNMLKDLSNIYGKEKGFEDDELFNRIEMITYPEIEDFFVNYVEGSKPLPLKEVFEKIGVEYLDSLLEKEVTFGEISLGYSAEKDRLLVRSTEKMNDFGKAVGFMMGDELVRINGVLINGDNFLKVTTQLKSSIKEGENITFSVARYNKKGKEKIYDLSAPAVIIEKMKYNLLLPMENPTEAQLKLRKAWGNI